MFFIQRLCFIFLYISVFFKLSWSEAVLFSVPSLIGPVPWRRDPDQVLSWLTQNPVLKIKQKMTSFPPAAVFITSWSVWRKTQYFISVTLRGKSLLETFSLNCKTDFYQLVSVNQFKLMDPGGSQRKLPVCFHVSVCQLENLKFSSDVSSEQSELSGRLVHDLDPEPSQSFACWTSPSGSLLLPWRWQQVLIPVY